MGSNNYIEINFSISDPDYREMIMAELSLHGFDPIIETDHGLICHSEQELFESTILDDITSHYSEHVSVSWTSSLKPVKNWNEEWEKSYQPVEVDNCRIRADFHAYDPAFEIDIVINPQMSFGTGHHDTTAGMIKEMLRHKFENSIVIDAGTGTGVLAIVASKLGADRIVAFDIEDHVVENARQNVERNACKVELQTGTIRQVSELPYADVFLANINRNVLLDEIPHYQNFIKTNGLLILSGFYQEDLKLIEETIERNRLVIERRSISSNNWAIVTARKMG